MVGVREEPFARIRVRCKAIRGIHCLKLCRRDVMPLVFNWQGGVFL